MTSVTDDLRLAADFPPATYDDWRKLVDGVLKGAPFEKLVGKTYDGLKIEPIYPRAARRRSDRRPRRRRALADHAADRSSGRRRRPTRRRCTISRTAPPGSTLVFAGGHGRARLWPATRSAEAIEAGSRRRLHRCRNFDRASGRSAVADGARSTSPNMIEAQRRRPRGLSISASALDPIERLRGLGRPVPTAGPRSSPRSPARSTASRACGFKGPFAVADGRRDP